MESGVHVALLRAINVGGTKKLLMADLRAMFEAAGCTDVRTYIQSGNVVFRAEPALAERIPALVEAEIVTTKGFEVPVVTRSAAELDAVVTGNPFLAAGADPTQLHVGFLAEAPTAARIAELDPDRSPGDAFEVRGREVYLHFPNGTARSKLTVDYFDRTLGTTITIRNWRTVGKLREMTGGD
ncbi:MAG: DUF1697 domain-containing protein [Chloroflexota bacterium]|nr:DUF1697 domain-containing protein [Chloroflexota bacterium]